MKILRSQSNLIDEYGKEYTSLYVILANDAVLEIKDYTKEKSDTKVGFSITESLEVSPSGTINSFMFHNFLLFRTFTDKILEMLSIKKDSNLETFLEGGGTSLQTKNSLYVCNDILYKVLDDKYVICNRIDDDEN